MKNVLFTTITLIGIIAIFIDLHPLILLGIYGIIVIIPLVIIILNKDLVYGLYAWFLLVLFSRTIGKVVFPMFPDIDLYRVIWIFLFLVFFAQTSIKGRKLLPVTKTEILMVLFCVVCLASMARAGTIFKAGEGLTIRTFLNGYAIPFSIFFLSKNIVEDEDKIKKLFQVLLVVGIYITLTGIFEHFNLTGLVFPRYIMDPNIGIHWGRARGPFVMASVNGAVLGMVFLTSIYLVINMRKGGMRIFYIIFVALMPITIFFTYTRSCWLGFILSLLIVPFFYPRLRKVFLLGIFIICIIAIFNWSNVMSENRTVGGVTSVNQVYSRINLYGASLRMFLERPIFGFGFETFRELSHDYFYEIKGIPLQSRSLSRHDTLVGILVELGLIGFIPLLLIYFYIFKHSINLYHKLSNKSFLGRGLVTIFWGISIVFMVNMQFHEMRFFLFSTSIFFLVAGIIVGLDQRTSLGKDIVEDLKSED